MADNICGPSNALQNIQKRSNVDRTLQQDRLVGRASSSQGFRVSPGQNAGQLDAEFAAFQAGHQSLSPSPAVQNFFPRHFQTPSPLSLQNGSSQHTADQGWATDFQNLNISGPQAQFQQQALHQVHQPQMGGGWHQEFAQSFGGSSSVLKGKQPATGMNGPSMMNPRYNPLPPRILMQQNQIASTGPLMAQQNEAFDDAAFARAFEEAANADLEREREKEQELESTKAQTEDAQFTIDQKAELELERAANNLLNQASLGADKIQDPAAATPEQRLDAPDALSRTAGELLHRVSNDRSEKFQNSQFLQLMRQFRDKEVAVEGDEVVDTAKAKSGVYQNGMAGEFHDLVGSPRA